MNEETQLDIGNKFRRRAKTLRALAYSVLFLIAVTLAGGVYLFVIAGEIVSAEAAIAQEKVFEQLQKQLSELAPQTQRIISELTQLAGHSEQASRDLGAMLTAYTEAANEVAFAAREFRENAGGVKSAEMVGKLDNLINVISSDEFLNSVREISTDAPYIMKNLVAVTQELKAVSTIASEKLADFLESQKSSSTSLLITTLATRVGALLILIFLVQILINLYRYNIRLSTYFDARADAVEMYLSKGFEHLSLTELMTVLSPDNLDFGKSPVSPVQHAVDLAKEIIARQPGK